MKELSLLVILVDDASSGNSDRMALSLSVKFIYDDGGFYGF